MHADRLLDAFEAHRGFRQKAAIKADGDGLVLFLTPNAGAGFVVSGDMGIHVACPSYWISIFVVGRRLGTLAIRC